MRSLGERAARACEDATTARCRCRCGGALHGAGRTKASGGALSDVWDLPKDDPHYPDSGDTQLPLLEVHK